MRDVALLGKAGVGKTTVANLLGSERVSWADGVREVARLAYDVPNDPEGYSKWKASRSVTVRVRDELVATTGRDLLQRLGTEAIRQTVDEDFWVRVGLRRIDSLGHAIVNDDTRFVNEAEALSRRRFVFVALCGESFAPIPSDHASEAGIEYLVEHFADFRVSTRTDRGTPREPGVIAREVALHLGAV